MVILVRSFSKLSLLELLMSFLHGKFLLAARLMLVVFQLNVGHTAFNSSLHACILILRHIDSVAT